MPEKKKKKIVVKKAAPKKRPVRKTSPVTHEEVAAIIAAAEAAPDPDVTQKTSERAVENQAKMVVEHVTDTENTDKTINTEGKKTNTESKEASEAAVAESTPESVEIEKESVASIQTTGEPMMEGSDGDTDANDKVFKVEETRSFTFPLVMMLCFAVGLVGGFVLFQQITERRMHLNLGFLSQPTPTPTPEKVMPTVEPTKGVDKSAYEISVLNGSGIAGEAGRAKAALEAAGYSVGTTDNADKYDYTETIVRYKKGTNPSFLDALRKQLGRIYTVSTDAQTPYSSGADVIIIIGSKKAAG